MANTAGEERAKGRMELKRGPGSPRGPCQGLVFVSEVPSPTLNAKSIQKLPILFKVWNSVLISLSFPLHGTSHYACFLFAKVIRMEMTRTL